MTPQDVMTRADGDGLAPCADQGLPELGPGEVGGGLEALQAQVGLRVEAPGGAVAAPGGCRRASATKRGLNPPDGAGATETEWCGGGVA